MGAGRDWNIRGDVRGIGGVMNQWLAYIVYVLALWYCIFTEEIERGTIPYCMSLGTFLLAAHIIDKIEEGK